MKTQVFQFDFETFKRKKKDFKIFNQLKFSELKRIYQRLQEITST